MNTKKIKRNRRTFKITKKIIIGFILMFIGAIMIISSFFIPDNSTQCVALAISSIFTSSFIIFGIGLLLSMIGLAITDVEYRKQTGWKRAPR
jgi:ABC-type polysaccharide/polyol phosphate export permease